MSPISGYLTPEARAGWDVVLAKLAAPGMCNPDDITPCVSGTPSQAAIDNDARSVGQRNHDALAALTRAALASGDLGRHNGLPASIIVTTTLKELEAGIGTGLAGGGTLLPMSDVIRLASHAHHYLAIFDKGEAIGLYHTKQLAFWLDRGHAQAPFVESRFSGGSGTDCAKNALKVVQDLASSL